MEKEHYGTVIIGAGQAGLSAAYYLKRIDEDFILLDEGIQVGDSWRRRWDSLRLFTPAQHDSLPGFPIPAKRGVLPTKEYMADYLSNYATKYAFPIQLETKVIELNKTTDNYEIVTGKGKVYADQVIVATGTNQKAYIPAFASELDKGIHQIHSSEYLNPHLFSASDTLVVGAGTSGVEIALELAGSRPTIISGRPTPHIPDFIFRFAGSLYWWFAHHVLSTGTPIGRKVKPKILGGGAPLISVSVENLKDAHVEQVPRLRGVTQGWPQTEDGRILNVASIVWATGFIPDFSWIKLDVAGHNGWPTNHRGISEKYSGLYFVGMLFQYALTSGLVGGVSRDAAYVVNHIKMAKAK